jgi:GT2 family glycosyltransferase
MTTGRAAGAPTVAVVVCAYTGERWSDIRDGLNALSGQTRPPDDVILVIDHNEPLEQRAREELSGLLPGLRIVSSTGVPGVSGARNTGIAATASEIVAFLDDDARPEPEWLAELTAPFQNPDVWITGGRALPGWPTRRPGWWPEEFDWIVGSSYRGLPTTTAPVRNVFGATMAIRREAFVAAGTFREGVGRVGKNALGCEETELCIRLRQARPEAQVVYVPASVVTHRVSRDRVSVRYFLTRCYAEGRSKALIRRTVGTDATASERTYATRVLTGGVLRGLRDTGSGFARSVAIIVGLLTTVLGFIRGNPAATDKKPLNTQRVHPRVQPRQVQAGSAGSRKEPA